MDAVKSVLDEITNTPVDGITNIPYHAASVLISIYTRSVRQDWRSFINAVPLDGPLEQVSKVTMMMVCACVTFRLRT